MFTFVSDALHLEASPRRDDINIGFDVLKWHTPTHRGNVAHPSGGRQINVGSN